jgi:O-antigen/teichoic acid export membrane protein
MREQESKVWRGLFWLGASGGALRVIDLLGSFVILWKLSAEQMGLASLAWTVAMILESFNGLGVGVALVQAPELDREELDSLFWFCVLFGALLCSGIAVASPSVAAAFGRGPFWPMLVVACTRVLFTSIALVPLQLLQRKMDFKTLAVVQTLAAAAAATAKMTLLLADAGAWALVISHATEGLFTLVVVYALAPFWPRFRVSIEKTRRFVRFGARAAASAVLYQSYRNLDFVIVGRAFGVTSLGAYRIAFDIAMTPAMAILDVVNRTAFPIYARIGVSHPDSLKRTFLTMTRRLALVTGPLAVLSAFYAPDILSLVSGARWAAAGPMIKVLCWAAFLRTMAQSIPQLFHAAARPELAAYDSLLTLPCFVTFGWALVHWFGLTLGPNAVSLAWIATYLCTLLVLFLMARGIVPMKAREFLRSLVEPAGLMLLLWVFVALAQPPLRRALPLSIATALGLGASLALGAALARYVLRIRFARRAASAARHDGDDA